MTEVLGGGNTEVDVTPLDELPDDAPTLHIDVGDALRRHRRLDAGPRLLTGPTS